MSRRWSAIRAGAMEAAPSVSPSIKLFSTYKDELEPILSHHKQHLPLLQTTSLSAMVQDLLSFWLAFYVLSHATTRDRVLL
jgi:hypothetical protein